MSLSLELPDTEDINLKAYFERFISNINVELNKSNHFPERREKVVKPQIGHVYYFGDPLTHSYDIAITAEGWWGYKSTGWVQLA